MQHVEAVPVRADEAALLGDAPRRSQDARPVRTRQRTLSNDDHRVRGLAQHFGPGMLARCERVEQGGVIAERLDRKGQVEGRADAASSKPPRR